MALSSAERSRRRRERRSPEKAEAERLAALRRYHEHSDRHSMLHRLWIKNRKIEIFDRYGGCRCRNCSEIRLGALHLDHIEGNGADHRKLVGTRNVYKWVVDHNYPPGFRVLCANCNWRERLAAIVHSTTANARRLREKSRRLRVEFFALLGEMCVVCGTTDIDVLTAHHLENDGKAHRTRISYGIGGHIFYRAVLKTRDITGLETRCFSCNDCASVEINGDTLC